MYIKCIFTLTCISSKEDYPSINGKNCPMNPEYKAWEISNLGFCGHHFCVVLECNKTLFPRICMFFFPQCMYTYTQNIDALIFRSPSLTARIRFRIIATELLNRIKANHKRRKVKNIGGQGLEYWGGGGARGAISQQAHGVILTSMRRNNVASTSVRRMCPLDF